MDEQDNKPTTTHLGTAKTNPACLLSALSFSPSCTSSRYRGRSLLLREQLHLPTDEPRVPQVGCCAGACSRLLPSPWHPATVFSPAVPGRPFFLPLVTSLGCLNPSLPLQQLFVFFFFSLLLFPHFSKSDGLLGRHASRCSVQFRPLQLCLVVVQVSFME